MENRQNSNSAVMERPATQTRKAGRPRKITAPVVDATDATAVDITPKKVKVKKERVNTLVPIPITEFDEKNPLKVKFFVGDKQFVSKVEIPNPFDARKKSTTVYHIYVPLWSWPTNLPTEINPRDHNKSIFKSEILKQTEEGIINEPEAFIWKNRGITALISDFHYENGNVTFTLESPEMTGLSDGGGSNLIIHKIRNVLAKQILKDKNASFEQLTEDQIPEQLKVARVHVECILGLNDRKLVEGLAAGRNSSKQVKNYSLVSFSHKLDFLKKVLESPESPVQNRLSYNENAPGISILTILAYLTLFQEELNQIDPVTKIKRSAVISYSNRGRLANRVEQNEKSYKKLTDIVIPILKLHDYVYAKFPEGYDLNYPGGRLGRKQGVSAREHRLPITKTKALYSLPPSYVLVLLSGFRALISYKSDKARFITDPFAFFDKYKKELAAEIINLVDEMGTNAFAKKASSYETLYNKVKLLYLEEKEEK